ATSIAVCIIGVTAVQPRADKNAIRCSYQCRCCGHQCDAPSRQVSIVSNTLVARFMYRREQAAAWSNLGKCAMIVGLGTMNTLQLIEEAFSHRRMPGLFPVSEQMAPHEYDDV